MTKISEMYFSTFLESWYPSPRYQWDWLLLRTVHYLPASWCPLLHFILSRLSHCLQMRLSYFLDHRFLEIERWHRHGNFGSIHTVHTTDMCLHFFACNTSAGEEEKRHVDLWSSMANQTSHTLSIKCRCHLFKHKFVLFL